MRSRFAFLWLLATAAIAGVAAYVAYGAGVATHLTGAAASEGVAYDHPWFGFGLLLPILVIAVLFLALRPRRWARGGWGGPGMRGGFPQGLPPQVEQRLQDWHRGAHGSAGTDATPEPGPGAPQAGV